MSSHLKEAIGDLLARHGTKTRPSLEPAILRVAQKLPDGAGDLPTAKNYDAISSRLANALTCGERLTGREARDGAWCLWTTKVAIAERTETDRKSVV